MTAQAQWFLLEAVVVVLLLGLLRRLFRWLVVIVAVVVAAVVAVAVVAGVAQQVSSRTRRPPSVSLVADSNVFQDVVPCRRTLDALLDDPAVTLIVNAVILTEAAGRQDRQGSQEPRLSRLSWGGARRIPDATPPPADVAWLVSAAFDEVDATVLETAVRHRIPVLTTNAAALRRQIDSHPARRAHFGAVRLIDPCTDPLS